jgi:hypothetical protein
MLDQKVEGFADRIGVEAACQAFGVNPRTLRLRSGQALPASPADQGGPAADGEAETKKSAC